VSDAVKTAARALHRFRFAGARASDVPTPERLVRASGNASVERFSEAIEIDRDGRPESTTVEAVRIRVCDAPLDRLAARRQLAPNDPERNQLLYRAGQAYREAWFKAGLSPLRAVDPGREPTSSGPPEFFRGDSQIDAFAAFTIAGYALGEHELAVARAVILEEIEPVEIGRKISGYSQAKQAGAIALFLLRSALQSLGAHSGLLTRCTDLGPNPAG